ncbi:MAG: pilus assembly protein TadG-related protein [Galactobacter sp.]
MHRTQPRLRGESGRITILVCGLLVVLVAVIGVTASAAYVTAQQRKLLGVTDAAAAAAADRVVGQEMGQESGPSRPGPESAVGLRVDERAVRGAVVDYLRDLGTVDGLENVKVADVRVEADGITARVRLQARIGAPWAAALVGGSSDVIATSWVRISVER